MCCVCVLSDVVMMRIVFDCVEKVKEIKCLDLSGFGL